MSQECMRMISFCGRRHSVSDSKIVTVHVTEDKDVTGMYEDDFILWKEA